MYARQIVLFIRDEPLFPNIGVCGFQRLVMALIKPFCILAVSSYVEFHPHRGVWSFAVSAFPNRSCSCAKALSENGTQRATTQQTIKLSKPLCLLRSSACNLLIPTPGIFRQSIALLQLHRSRAAFCSGSSKSPPEFLTVAHVLCMQDVYRAGFFFLLAETEGDIVRDSLLQNNDVDSFAQKYLSFEEEMEKGMMVLLKIQHAGSNTSAQVHSGKKRRVHLHITAVKVLRTRPSVRKAETELHVHLLFSSSEFISCFDADQLRLLVNKYLAPARRRHLPYEHQWRKGKEICVQETANRVIKTKEDEKARACMPEQIKSYWLKDPALPNRATHGPENVKDSKKKASQIVSLSPKETAELTVSSFRWQLLAMTAQLLCTEHGDHKRSTFDFTSIYLSVEKLEISGRGHSPHLYVDICELLIKPSCCSKVQQGHLEMDKAICIRESTILVEPDLRSAPDFFRKLSWLSLHPSCPSSFVPSLQPQQLHQYRAEEEWPMPSAHTATPALLTALLRLRVQGQSSTEPFSSTLQHRPQGIKRNYIFPTEHKQAAKPIIAQEHLTEESWAQLTAHTKKHTHIQIPGQLFLLLEQLLVPLQHSNPWLYSAPTPTYAHIPALVLLTGTFPAALCSTGFAVPQGIPQSGSHGQAKHRALSKGTSTISQVYLISNLLAQPFSLIQGKARHQLCGQHVLAAQLIYYSWDIKEGVVFQQLPRDGGRRGKHLGALRADRPISNTSQSPSPPHTLAEAAGICFPQQLQASSLLTTSIKCSGNKPESQTAQERAGLQKKDLLRLSVPQLQLRSSLSELRSTGGPREAQSTSKEMQAQATQLLLSEGTSTPLLYAAEFCPLPAPTPQPKLSIPVIGMAVQGHTPKISTQTLGKSRLQAIPASKWQQALPVLKLENQSTSWARHSWGCSNLCRALPSHQREQSQILTAPSLILEHLHSPTNIYCFKHRDKCRLLWWMCAYIWPENTQVHFPPHKVGTGADMCPAKAAADLQQNRETEHGSPSWPCTLCPHLLALLPSAENLILGKLSILKENIAHAQDSHQVVDITADALGDSGLNAHTPGSPSVSFPAVGQVVRPQPSPGKGSSSCSHLVCQEGKEPARLRRMCADARGLSFCCCYLGLTSETLRNIPHHHLLYWHEVSTLTYTLKNPLQVGIDEGIICQGKAHSSQCRHCILHHTKKHSPAFRQVRLSCPRHTPEKALELILSSFGVVTDCIDPRAERSASVTHQPTFWLAAVQHPSLGEATACLMETQDTEGNPGEPSQHSKGGKEWRRKIMQGCDINTQHCLQIPKEAIAAFDSTDNTTLWNQQECLRRAPIPSLEAEEEQALQEQPVPDTRVKSISKYLTLLPEHRNIRRQQASYKNPEHFCSSEPAFHSSPLCTQSRPRAAVTRLGHAAGTTQCCPKNLKLIPPMVDEFNCRADFQAWLAEPTYQRHWKARSTGAPPGSVLLGKKANWKDPDKDQQVTASKNVLLCKLSGILGRGEEILILVCGPFGRSNPELPSRAMPGTERAGRHPPTSSAETADQLLLIESQAGGSAKHLTDLTDTLQPMQAAGLLTDLPCRSDSTELSTGRTQMCQVQAALLPFIPPLSFIYFVDSSKMALPSISINPCPKSRMYRKKRNKNTRSTQDSHPALESKTQESRTGPEFTIFSTLQSLEHILL
ncbi:hypothetical protein IHE44_0008943 [Lamprotornis superbus]|uniref:Uncharacterized protein n=1 Tax=Lamprotornis superbus TaxID=245042 RepID=A0A835TV80_9PASS|nr:hypothetical protein IHE44_0008943 [Lamprotornis superbus]